MNRKDEMNDEKMKPYHGRGGPGQGGVVAGSLLLLGVGETLVEVSCLLLLLFLLQVLTDDVEVIPPVLLAIGLALQFLHGSVTGYVLLAVVERRKSCMTYRLSHCSSMKPKLQFSAVPTYELPSHTGVVDPTRNVSIIQSEETIIRHSPNTKEGAPHLQTERISSQTIPPYDREIRY